MLLATGFLLLPLAALLEAGGDALVRMGVHASVGLRRALMLGAGGLVLFVYGYVVNTAPWNFGRLIGVYIVCFFWSLRSLHGRRSGRHRRGRFCWAGS